MNLNWFLWPSVVSLQTVVILNKTIFPFPETFCCCLIVNKWLPCYYTITILGSTSSWESLIFELRSSKCETHMWPPKKVSFFYGGLLKTLTQTCRENTRTLPFWSRGHPTESYVLPERGRVALKLMLTYDHVVLCFKNSLFMI